MGTFYWPTLYMFNSSLNEKMLNFSKLKAFADDNRSVTKFAKFVCDRIGNILGKGKECWLPAFIPFLTMFSKSLFLRVDKVGILWYTVKN